jgi:hypothetical protein
VRGNTSVSTVKTMLQGQGEAPPDQQRIIFAGKQLEDGRTMADYRIGDATTIHMCLRLRGC